ncbi:MAG: arginine decarboxylase, pyruvoyl-dependent [Bacteroidales bacterium]|nr:arginine decarboxylase, pyruvoyl-dependent [Candidatus Latescibacterota bacterium]
MKKNVPSKIFLTRGTGKHREKLTSFEFALRDAGIAHLNLVQVSSIFPPRCKLVKRAIGIQLLEPGEVVFCVLSKNSSNEPNRLIGSAVGVSLPRDDSKYGYISEHHTFGKTRKPLGDYTEDLAASMLATTLGIEIDLDKAWDERKQEFMIGGDIVKTTNIAQTSRGEDGKWTTVIAAAVFCDYR